MRKMLPGDKGKSFYPFIYPYRCSCAAALIALIFTAGVTLGFGQGVRLLVDHGLANHSLAELNNTALIFLGMILLLGIGTFARFYLVTWIGERFIADIRQAVFNHVLHLPITFFEDQGVGDLQSRIITDTTLVQQFIGSSLSVALRNLLILIGGLCFLVIANYQLALIALLMMPVVLLPVLILGRRVRKLSNLSQQQVGTLGTYLNEALQQIKTLQAFNYQPYAQQQFAHCIQNTLQAAKQRITQRAWLVAVVIILILSAVIILLWTGGRWVLDGSLSGGELAAFLFYAVLVAGSAGALSEVWSEWQQVKGASERLLGILAIAAVPSKSIVSMERKPIQINIQNLSFTYASRTTPAIVDLNLSVAAGESLALVGPSGSGKSTLLELLLGFYAVKPGTLFIDNVDITTMSLEQLRAQIGWVSQQPAIFSGTVWDNLSYGEPQASHDAIIKAAEAAHVTEFIEQLPNGYKTLVGEGGVRLSGGQRQRIALARALLRKPRLLLLDEPTSALDAISEQMIQRALKEIIPYCTTIVIAHRLATVKSLNRIAVMQHGHLIAIGTHEELLETCQLYAELVHLQFI